MTQNCASSVLKSSQLLKVLCIFIQLCIVCKSQSLCPPGWISYPEESRCFKLVGTTIAKSWQDALSDCLSIGANLASIEFAEKKTFIESLVNNDVELQFWTGGNKRQDSAWIWSNSQSYVDNAIIKWTAGQMDGNCLQIAKKGVYTSEDCTVSKPYICERAMGMETYCDTDDGWETIDKNCIKVFSIQYSWSDARQFCLNQGGDLAIVSSASIQYYLRDWHKINKNPLWIGLSDRLENNQKLYWVDNITSISNEFWAPLQPIFISSTDGNCVMINDLKNGNWEVSLCTSERYFACQKQTGLCPSGWKPFKNKCYLFNEQQILYTDWYDAKDTCSDYGGKLAVIKDVYVQKFVELQLKNSFSNQDFWFGLANLMPVKNTFTWVDGDVASGFTNFANGKPVVENSRDNCAIVSTNRGIWYSSSNCYQLRPYICEANLNTTIIPNPSKIKTFGGNANARPCVFPFLYNNKLYYGCINTDRDNIWCSVTFNYDIDGNWGYCPYVGTCEKDWSEYDSNCYARIEETKNLDWETAKANCEKQQASLAIIRDSKTQALIDKLFTSKNIFSWIGLQNINDQWTWIDTTVPNDFKNWKLGNPTLTTGPGCAVTSGETLYLGQWTSVPCKFPLTNSYICQKQSSSKVIPTITPATTITWSDKCGTGWFERPLSGYCYSFSDEFTTFQGAKAKCASNNGVLVSILDVHEQLFVQNNLVSLKLTSFWIAANQESLNKGWIWLDDSPFIFANWAAGEYKTGPNQFCAIMSSDLRGQWKTVDCASGTFGYICKKQQTSANTKPTQVLTPFPTISGAYYGCQQDWNINQNNYCYKVFNDLKSFDGAKTACKSISAELVEIYSETENEFLISIAGNNSAISTTNMELLWIGMFDELIGFASVSLKWNSGNIPLYTNWASGQPEVRNMPDTPKCVSFIKQDYRNTNGESYDAGQWIISNCDQSFNYICRRPIQQVEAPITSTQTPGCPQGFKGHEKKCYTELNEYLSWNEAEKKCQNLNPDTNLVSILDKFEQYWLNYMFSKPNQFVWIGLGDSKTFGRYEWTSRESVTFLNWDRNQPEMNVQKQCTAMNSNGFWSKFPCDTKLTSICMATNAKFTTLSTTTLPPIKCADGWTAADNQCYKAFDTEKPESKTWYEAEAFCRNRGGNLASFKSATGFNKIYREQGLPFKRDKSFWIGLNRLDNDKKFKWSDSSALTYTNWAYGQPDNHNGVEDCVEIRYGQWYDSNCYINKGWVCQIPGGVNPNATDVIIPPDVFNTTKCEIVDNSTLNWIQFRDKCYFISNGTNDQKLSWYKAREFCRSNSGFLVSIHSRLELQFIAKQAGKIMDRWWIGLNQLTTKAGFVWSDNTPVNFLNWDKGEPNDANGGENCVEMYGFNGFWNDNNCGNGLGFVCERLKTGDEQENTDSFVQPLSFGDGAVCPPGYSTFGVTSSSRSENNEQCVFPFLYKGTLYYECITLDWYSPWCATTANYDQDEKWGNCLSVKCFKIVENRLTYQGARSFCDRENAALASISNDLEQNYLTALLNGKRGDYFIGASYNGEQLTSLSFSWDDNTDFVYTKWAPGKPSGNPTYVSQRCVALSANKNTPGLWSNMECYYSNPFICAKNSYGVKYTAGCQNSSVSQNIVLSCEPKTKVVVIRASYGRSRYSYACDTDYYTGSCMSKRGEVRNILNNLCKSNETCSINADMSLFADPCPNVTKHLKVWYQCVGDVIVTGGNSNGSACVFPFKYKGRDINQCTYVDNEQFGKQKWCATTGNYDTDKKWGACPSLGVDTNPPCRKSAYVSIDSGNNCYKIVNNETKNWNDANNYCKADGGNLVSIRDGFEQAYVSLIKYSGSVKSQWIGLINNDSSQFYWTDNWPLTYVNWAKEWVNDSQIKDYCGYIRANDDFWDAESCKNEKNFICKISKDTAPEVIIETPGYCPDKWVPFGSSCYKFDGVSRTYPDAKFDCFFKNSTIASMQSKTEMDFITGLVDANRPNPRQLWIGLERNQVTGSFYWSDNSVLSFTSFSSDFKSTMNCVYMYDGKWYDTDCFPDINVYVCKQPKMLNATSTIPAVTTTPSIDTTTESTASTATTLTLTTTADFTNEKQTKSSSTFRTVAIAIGIAVAFLVILAVTLIFMRKNGICFKSRGGTGEASFSKNSEIVEILNNTSFSNQNFK